MVILQKTNVLVDTNILDLIKVPDKRGGGWRLHQHEELGVGVAYELTQDLVAMGFPERAAQLAVQNIEIPDVALAIEWIQTHESEIDNQTIQDSLR